MKTALAALAVLGLLAGCRGEPVPRDYQNTPTNTRSTDDREDAPTAEWGTATPEPDATAEGTSAPYEPAGSPAGDTEKQIQRVPPEPQPPPQ